MGRNPVHLLTGFLGAGKTTLLNRLLGDPRMNRTAVIVNEFGDVALDHLFIASAGETVIELANGCLCCTVRGELFDTLLSLSRNRLDRVIIETSGLAEPHPVLSGLIAHPEISRYYSVGSIITVIDPTAILPQIEEFAEARAQIALADQLVFSSTGSVPASPDTVSTIRAINPLAGIVGPDGEETVARLLGPSGGEQTLSPALNAKLGHGGHSARFRTMTFESSVPMPRAALEEFLACLRDSYGPAILRLKGMVQIEGSSVPLVIQAASGNFGEPSPWDYPSPPPAGTRLVAITRDLDSAAIHDLFATMTGGIRPDTPDRYTVAANPLAIPGFRPRR